MVAHLEQRGGGVSVKRVAPKLVHLHARGCGVSLHGLTTATTRGRSPRGVQRGRSPGLSRGRSPGVSRGRGPRVRTSSSMITQLLLPHFLMACKMSPGIAPTYVRRWPRTSASVCTPPSLGVQRAKIDFGAAWRRRRSLCDRAGAGGVGASPPPNAGSRPGQTCSAGSAEASEASCGACKTAPRPAG